MTAAILFDDGLGVLAPMTDLRPAFDIRTGALTTYQRHRHVLGLEIAALRVPAELAALAAETHDVPINSEPSGEVLMLSGRCPLPPQSVLALGSREALVEGESGHLIAARGPGRELPRLIAGDHAGYAVATHDERSLLGRSWHVRASRDACIDADLSHLTRGPRQDPPPGVFLIGEHTVRVHATARVCKSVVLDAEKGPIVIDAGAVVRPGSILCGPCSIGVDSTVLERSLIKAHTAIGPVCKVAGEVGGTIFQSHANKGHEGHLGDSWVGAWANLGAGTTNSNLLNTYGEVSAVATPDGPRERTGERYLGATIGDHVKLAICTRLMTGVVIHTGAMLAETAAVSGCVRPFAWGTDAGRQLYKLPRFLEVAETVMARRSVEPGRAYLERLEHFHAACARRYWPDAGGRA